MGRLGLDCSNNDGPEQKQSMNCRMGRRFGASHVLVQSRFVYSINLPSVQIADLQCVSEWFVWQAPGSIYSPSVKKKLS